MRQEIETATHDGSTQQQSKLANVEKKTSYGVHQQSVVFCKRVGIVNVEQFDAKEEKARCSNEAIMLGGRCLVLKELTGNNNQALQEKSHQ